MSEMSPADISAMCNNCNGNNGMWNNPFMYLVWLALFRNGGFGFGNGDAAAAATLNNDARFNQLSQQISDNQNTNAIGAGITGNHEALHGVFGALNTGFDGVNASINASSTTNLMGQKDLQSAIQSCCCNNQTAILNQTNQLQTQIEGTRQAVVNGFANIGYAISQQTNELNTNATANTQRILDHMCNSETQALRDKVFQMSQEAQTAQIVGKINSGCNCG